MKKTDVRPDGKNALANFFLHLASIVISAAALVYLGYHFINSFSFEITTEYAIQVTENDTVSLDAYILRNETIIYSNVTGNVSSLFANGTKVKGGNIVANIYGGSRIGSDGKIVELDRKIDLLTESSLTEGLSSSDTYIIDSRISDYYYTIRRSAELGTYSNLQKRRDGLLTLLNRRKIITGAVEGYGDIIQNLEYERERLTSSFDSVSETVEAPISGYYYSKLDGYESVFTADTIKSLTIDGFYSMINREPAVYPDNAVGKLATDFDWYFVSESTRDSLRYFLKNTDYTVNFPYNDDASLRLRLYDIVTEVGKEKVLLVFKSNYIPEDFSFRRMQPVEVVRKSYTGYKVPISAARLVDGVQGVYILIGNLVEFREIKVLLELNGYYIVAPQDIENDLDYRKKLGLYDSIIIGGKNLYVGKMIS